MGLPVLSIKSRNDRRLRAGHLWIFSNEVSTQKTPLKGFRPGDEVTVLDNRDKPLGSACINPATLICGRLHSFGPDVPLDRNLIGPVWPRPSLCVKNASASPITASASAKETFSRV